MPPTSSFSSQLTAIPTPPIRLVTGWSSKSLILQLLFANPLILGELHLLGVLAGLTEAGGVVSQVLLAWKLSVLDVVGRLHELIPVAASIVSSLDCFKNGISWVPPVPLSPFFFASSAAKPLARPRFISGGAAIADDVGPGVML